MTYPWGHERRYNDFPTYFRNRFKERVQKVSIDAGFTCPNRDGKVGKGGCAYCNNKTFQPTYCQLEESVTEQIEKGVGFFSKKYKSMQYLAYFQAYSNTYAPIDVLRNLYSEALKHPKIIGLVIATRPDCLTDEVLDLLEEYAKDWYVMVEFGVESCNDDTLRRINRGHDFAAAERAITETSKRGIHNCAHMILGLPGESRDEILNQARILSSLPVENLKLHQLQIHKGTRLEVDFKEKPEEFQLYTAEEYVDLVVDYLELLSPKIIVERFISQAPPELLIAPKWGLKNFEFVAKVEKRLVERGTWQGKAIE